MTESGATWGISTGGGVTLGADELIPVLATHHERVLHAWRGFTSEEWRHPSRNADWTVHETARHVADAVEHAAVAAGGRPGEGVPADFDPRSTPVDWLVSSAGESAADTIRRFEEGAARFRVGVGDRLKSGDGSHDRTVFGSAHWTVNVVHVLWDSWIHERDVLIPLGRPADSSSDEQRLVGLYGLFMSLLPSMMMDQTISTTVELTGAADHTVGVSCAPGLIVSTEVAPAGSGLTGATAAVVDALTGRGATVEEALPGAPAELGFLAAFFRG